MARIEVQTKKPDIHIIVDTGTNKDVVEMVKEIYGFIASRNEPAPNPAKILNIQEERPEPPAQHFTQTPITVPGMRERLPNNVIDPSELNVTKAIKENALVRCPHCGQNHIIAVKSHGNIYAMRMNYKKKNYEALTVFPDTDAEALKGICFDTDRELYREMAGDDVNKMKKAYWQDVQDIIPTVDDVDFVATNETEIFCPVCGQSDTFMKWKDCYSNPLNYFEYDHICDACGGEMSIIQKKKGQSYYRCDKCDWYGGASDV